MLVSFPVHNEETGIRGNSDLALNLSPTSQWFHIRSCALKFRYNHLCAWNAHTIIAVNFWCLAAAIAYIAVIHFHNYVKH